MKFTGPEQAVRFAHQMSQREIASKPDYESVGRSTSRDGLGPHELHAQGALILQAVGRLPEREKLAMAAVLAPHNDGLAACQALSIELWPHLEAKLPHKDAAYDAICLWSRRAGGGVRAVAARHEVSFRQVLKWRDAVGRVFSPLYLRAVELLEQDLFRPDGLELKNA